MELLAFAGALVVLDVAAYFFGYDTHELAQFERGILKDVWPGF
jgi:hypothetical protein